LSNSLLNLFDVKKSGNCVSKSFKIYM